MIGFCIRYCLMVPGYNGATPEMAMIAKYYLRFLLVEDQMVQSYQEGASSNHGINMFSSNGIRPVPAVHKTGDGGGDRSTDRQK